MKRVYLSGVAKERRKKEKKIQEEKGKRRLEDFGWCPSDRNQFDSDHNEDNDIDDPVEKIEIVNTKVEKNTLENNELEKNQEIIDQDINNLSIDKTKEIINEKSLEDLKNTTQNTTFFYNSPTSHKKL